MRPTYITSDVAIDWGTGPCYGCMFDMMFIRRSWLCNEVIHGFDLDLSTQACLALK